MSSTTASSATASAPKPVENTAKPAQANARTPKEKTDGQDMFASLLSLLANTQVLPEATTLTAATPGELAPGDPTTLDGTENPFAALLGWGLPGSGKDAASRPATTTNGASLPGSTGAAGTADRPAASAVANTGEAKIDISGMTPVEPTPLELPALEANPKGQVALPANATRPGAPNASTRLADGLSTTTMATTAATAATATTAAPWRQAAMASTETVALQQASNHSAQARSTVALNERFGLTPGVPLATTEAREAGTEGFGLASTAGVAGRTAEAAPAALGATPGDASMASDNTGSDASAFDQTDGKPDHPFNHANASEEPTVTHWGTQHLRHASLRVGGEADAQAIDIQLSMKGQEVQVAFNTDSAEARASLRENAGESLGDLLNKSGIQLGGVSVGSQGQSGARGDAAGARSTGVREAGKVANEHPVVATRGPQATPRADGSQPLDVFA